MTVRSALVIFTRFLDVLFVKNSYYAASYNVKTYRLIWGTKSITLVQ